MEINNQIRNYIVSNFLYGDSNIKLDNDQSLLDSGIIDSTGVLELVSFIEEDFDIKINDDELVPENLDSIINITQFIEQKRNN